MRHQHRLEEANDEMKQDRNSNSLETSHLLVLSLRRMRHRLEEGNDEMKIATVIRSRRLTSWSFI
jgi:hypothetical protein